jgi:hypothetical protein
MAWARVGLRWARCGGPLGPVDQVLVGRLVGLWAGPVLRHDVDGGAALRESAPAARQLTPVIGWLLAKFVRVWRRAVRTSPSYRVSDPCAR